MANQENADLQNRIISQWASFSQTEAFKDWEQSMNETMQMIQDNVDNMVESRPTAIPGVQSKQPITLEQAGLMNQRKVGIKYSLQYAKLRAEADLS